MVTLYECYQLSFDDSLLNQCIKIVREVVNMPAKDPYFCANDLLILAEVLRVRSRMRDNLASLQESIQYWQQAIPLLTDNTERARELSAVGTALLSQHRRTPDAHNNTAKSLQVLKEVLSLKQRAAKICPRDHLDYVRCLHELGLVLFCLYQEKPEDESLKQSIKAQQHALDFCPSSHPVRLEILDSLATAYNCQYETSGTPVSVTTAMGYVTEAVSQYVSPVQDRLSVVGNHLSTIHGLCMEQRERLNHHLPFLLDTYKAVVRLLPLVASFGLDPRARLKALADSDMVGVGASATALAIGRELEALELLEAARAVFWSQALRLQASLEELPSGSEDKDKLQNLFQILRTGAKERSSVLPTWQKLESARLCRTSKKAERLIEQVWKQPGLERFLLNHSFQALAQASAKGPVVVLIAHKSCCEAIIIMNPRGDIDGVTPPKWSFQALSKFSQKLKDDGLRHLTAASNVHHNPAAGVSQPDKIKVIIIYFTHGL